MQKGKGGDAPLTEKQEREKIQQELDKNPGMQLKDAFKKIKKAYGKSKKK